MRKASNNIARIIVRKRRPGLWVWVLVDRMSDGCYESGVALTHDKAYEEANRRKKELFPEYAAFCKKQRNARVKVKV